MSTGDDDEWPWTSALPPVRPVYPFGDPGAPIELYSGPIAVDSVGPWDARIYADLAGDLQVRWSATRAEGWVDATDVDLTIEPPDASSNTVRAHRYRTSSDGEYVRVSGEIMDANVGSADAMCDRVIIHFTNLPRTSPADYLVDDGHYWAGRWVCSGAGWRLILDVRQDHSKVWDAMRESLVFVVTHVGELRRADGSSFRASEAAEAMTAFQTGFSFALARWVAPVAPVGFDAAGNRVWEQWASWRCSPAFNYLPWWDSANGEDLKAFMELFLDAWLDPDRHEVTRHVARHLIVAHHRGTTIEAKIMLVHAALEYLAWVTYVLSGKCSRKKYREAPAEKHLRDLLKDAGIDPAIPSGLQALQRFAQEEQLADGPAALTRLRNRLVHRKHAGDPYHIEGLVTEAWRLSMEYGELLLLGRIGYRGKYLPRTNMGQWVDSISVPWTI